ncbi:unnamed protein product [Didymodactylos carnosus]|uniref:Peptidase S1 domain-containing protein n=1 Tax=Didymodactylos carnosus TaxID=1234261 RepID=A0A814SSL2_9BILA|nr:unnamed protein product [Didymodactylos carnosus]CAF3915832.1 unnamed protein product [Didymodactylos carnosus]
MLLNMNTYLMSLTLFVLVYDQASAQTYVCSSNAQCGCSQYNPTLTRIVGGEDAGISTWGFVVSIRISGSHICGGTILSSTLILTAAHCVAAFPSSLSSVTIAAGSNYLSTPNQIRLVQRTHANTGYTTGTYINDIATLVLQSPLDLTDLRVTTICLPNISSSYLSSNEYPSANSALIAIGWGVLSAGSTTVSNSLKQVTIQAITASNIYCSRIISNSVYQFCAGNLTGGRDTCQGDSGGPLLMFINSTQQWQIVGITSYGYSCAVANEPGIYTRVAYYQNWISQNGVTKIHLIDN